VHPAAVVGDPTSKYLVLIARLVQAIYTL
jgi:hypothetical protein